MAKPRVIIADPDINYIHPLQQRFVEEFFEKIDLEIITEDEYFNHLFATPQKAEVLVVSESLYDPSLQRHNIGKIFVLTEQYEEVSTGEQNTDKIFKYTSIKEILNEIIGKSGSVLKIDSEAGKEPQIIAVYSASGGAGKTTVALGLASCLTQNYKKVLYINADWLQTFQRMLGNPSPVSANDVYAKLAKPSGNLYEEVKHALRKELFTYLPPFKASLLSLGLQYSVFEKLALSARKSGDYDYIIVDADSAFDEDKASLIDKADKVVIVVRQSLASVYATNMLVFNMNGSGSEKYVFVCNDFRKEEDNALISPAIAAKFTVSEYIGHIPDFDKYRAEDLANSEGIRKAGFLVI